jgi:hypothetical protein
MLDEVEAGTTRGGAAVLLVWPLWPLEVEVGGHYKGCSRGTARLALVVPGSRHMRALQGVRPHHCLSGPWASGSRSRQALHSCGSVLLI